MSVEQLIQDIYAATADGVVGAIIPEDRARLLSASDALRLAYEDPMAAVYRMMFSAHQQVALRVAIGMKIIDAAVQLNAPVDVDQLASHTNGDSALIKRIIRLLAGVNIFKEVEPGRFVLTILGKGFVTSSPFAQAVIHFSHNTEAVVGIPKFMAKHGYKNLEDPLNVPYQSVFHTDLHGFDHMKTIEVEQDAFNTVISFSRQMRGQNWFDLYPVEEKLCVDNPPQTLVVDVGGGLGHDLIAFKKRYPNLPGLLVTQDIQEVINSIKDLPSGIEAIAQDFFAPQPVKGAKLYFLRNVLHDWPDKHCKEILGRLRDAMDSNSSLLIQESEMPEFDAPFMSACMDISMMALFAGGERTRSEFRDLLDSAGLQLVETWTPQSPRTGGFGTLYEAVRKK